jgi:Protein of unknown function (DUF1344)
VSADPPADEREPPATRRAKTARIIDAGQNFNAGFSRTITMKRLVISAAIAAVVASSSLAVADQASGTVKAFDAKAMTLTLQDGSEYYLPQTFKDPGLKAGEKVSITWAMQNSERMASAVVIQ